MATVVIDPGHGGSDPGSVNGSRYEKNDNLRLAQAVGNILKNNGVNVIYTRTGDYYVSLLDRSFISNSNPTDLFISLHRNSSSNPAANGVENYVRLNPSQTDIQYATNVLNRVLAVGVQSNRGLKTGNYSVLTYTYAPAQLLELGFITNAVDNELFDRNFNAYAQAIANGILTSLGISLTTVGDIVVKGIQQTLNTRYGAGLTVDGLYGPATKRAIIKGVQTELNRQYNAGLTVDGLWGPRTKAAVRSVKMGDRGNIVYLLQAALYGRKYKTTPDGIFGAQTQTAVRNFQSSAGLTADGIAGPNTFDALFR